MLDADTANAPNSGRSIKLNAGYRTPAATGVATTLLWGVARVLRGDVTGGVWIAFTGWFLSAGAMAARDEAIRRVDDRPYTAAPAERQGQTVPRVL